MDDLPYKERVKDLMDLNLLSDMTLAGPGKT